MIHFANISLKWKLLIGFGIPLVLTVSVAAMAYYSLERLLQSSKWVAHTYEAIELGDSITASLVNMETGLRGYLIAGEEVFLEPFNQGKQEYQELMSRAKKKVADNPAQVARLNQVNSLQEKWFSQHIKVAMQYRKELNSSADATRNFIELSARTIGKEKFDALRTKIAELDQLFIQLNDHKAHDQIQTILIDMINQETGERGFLLSGQEASLESFNTGLTEFNKHIEDLRNLVKNTYAHGVTTNSSPSGNYIQKITTLIDAIVDLSNEWVSEVAQPEIEARRRMNNVTRTQDDISNFIEQGIGKKYMDEMREVLNQFVETENILIEIRNEEQQKTATTVKQVIIVGTLLSIAIGLLLTTFITHKTTAAIRKSVTIANNIAEDDLTNVIDTTAKDEMGQLLLSLDIMQSKIKERLNNERQATIELGRVKQALDNVSTNIMVTDTDYNIVYINNASKELFENFEADFKTEFPDFDSTKLIGTNIDNFHKNPSHQRSLLEKLSDTFITEINLGSRVAKLKAHPIIDKLGNRIGTIVEWNDRTQEVAVEEEVQSIVTSALSGNLTQRITLDNKQGFFKTLGQGINELVDVSEQVVNDMVRIMGAMARGDLNEHIEANYQGSFGQLMADANSTIAKLTNVISEVKQTSSKVLNDSNEISLGNDSLRQRTKLQALGLEKTSSNMERMTNIVQENAENAKQANKLAIGARNQAQQGSEVVKDTVLAMCDINKASTEISNIIGVINDIAFQTNLLALNASVEAARAGEQGRGFAVVASEVRNLAGRSATAAKEIKELIENSVEKVEEGSRLVNQSGEMLEGIIESVMQVTDIVGNISEASQEQAAGIKQVNKEIIHMDENTQKNAVLVEEASTAAKSMSEQSNKLSNLVSFFTIDAQDENQSEEYTTTVVGQEQVA